MKKSKREPSPLAGLNGQLMVTAAHRYCLGRRSYIVGSCIEWLRRWWDHFEDNTRCVMIVDTIQALMDDEAGDPMDVKAWKDFANWAWLQLTLDQRNYVRTRVRQRSDRPWPLDQF